MTKLFPGFGVELTVTSVKKKEEVKREKVETESRCPVFRSGSPTRSHFLPSIFYQFLDDGRFRMQTPSPKKLPRVGPSFLAGQRLGVKDSDEQFLAVVPISSV